MASPSADVDRSIGVFDSGVGGLTVVRELRRLLASENIEYLGDTARVPYGSKSKQTVIRYARACGRFLVERDVKMVVVACNTASAYAVEVLRKELSLPIVDAVAPGAQAAVARSGSGHIGVLGTLGTVRSGAYARAILAERQDAKVSAQACALLVPLAEEGWTDDDIAEQVAGRYLAELRDRDPEIDTLVLGCTHYPLLSSVIERAATAVFGHAVALVDSATSMAKVAREALASAGLLRDGDGPGQLSCSVTDASRLQELAGRFLGEEIDRFETVDLA